MPKFVTRAAVLGVVWLATQTAAPQAVAPRAVWGADCEFPVMNSVGRFFGVGYTHGGYHAAQDGRLNAISGRHPAADYRMTGVPHSAQPYSPQPYSAQPYSAQPHSAQPHSAQPHYAQPHYAQPLASTPDFTASALPAPVSAPEHSHANNPPYGSAGGHDTAASSQAHRVSEAVGPVHPYQPPPRRREASAPQSLAPQSLAPQSLAPQGAAQRNELNSPSIPKAVPLYDPSASLETIREVEQFSIIDTGFPLPVYQVSAASTANHAANRYR